MPMDREWLALTMEEAIEPGLEIVDCHHHLWDVAGTYGRYELDDLRTDTDSGHNIVETVFIDCGANYLTDGPEHLRPVGETIYVAGRADESDRTPGARIAAIVGHADLTLGADVAEVLQAHVDAAGGRFRGIRHSGARADDPAVPLSRTEPPAGLYGDPAFRQGATTLASMGLSFEAWQYHSQLADVADLARAVPELSIIVNHIGGPLGIGRWAGRRDEMLEQWRPAMAELASLENVFLKVGGIGMTRFGVGWENRERPPTSSELLTVWGDELGWCIDEFGPGRCMFESNFPVDGESCSYTVLWNALKKVSAGYSPRDRTALLSGTARSVYRLGV
ncbi:MAG: amidohydrolase family protein [Actinomycetia bacterium]|nr:amidohydrolase family protein [Actinomycetes bacterium]